MYFHKFYCGWQHTLSLSHLDYFFFIVLYKCLLAITGRTASRSRIPISIAQNMKTWHRMTLNKPWVLFKTCTVSLCSLCLICTVNLQSLYLDKAWSMDQTNRFTDWQNPVFSSIYVARQPWVKLFWYLILLTLLVSKVICCQLTGLIGMEGRQSFGEEWGVPAHAHLAHEQGVELTHILCWGFSKKKGRFGRQPLWLRLPLGFKREQTKCF